MVVISASINLHRHGTCCRCRRPAEPSRTGWSTLTHVAGPLCLRNEPCLRRSPPTFLSSGEEGGWLGSGRRGQGHVAQARQAGRQSLRLVAPGLQSPGVVTHSLVPFASTRISSHGQPRSAFERVTGAQPVCWWRIAARPQACEASAVYAVRHPPCSEKGEGGWRSGGMVVGALRGETRGWA